MQYTGVIDEARSPLLFAGFWIRVGAYFVDLAVLLIPNLLISFLSTVGIAASDMESFLVTQFVSTWNSILLVWIYTAVAHSSQWQATVGKKVLGIKVVDEKGDRISFGRATGRYFAMILSGLILFFGFMMSGWTRRKQGLHDMLAGTFVVREN